LLQAKFVKTVRISLNTSFDYAEVLVSGSARNWASMSTVNIFRNLANDGTSKSRRIQHTVLAIAMH